MASKARAAAAVLIGSLALGGCAQGEHSAPAPAAEPVAKGGGQAPPTASIDGKKSGAEARAGMPKTARKVIRSAELSIEVASPAVAETTVSGLVERLGGYVATAERESGADEGERTESRVRLALRVCWACRWRAFCGG